MNKKLINLWLDVKCDEAEEIYGSFTRAERKQYRFECLNKFNKFGIEYGFEFDEILDNFDLMVELDKLIDYDINSAISRARMELHQGEGLAHYRDEIKLMKGELKRIYEEQQKILGGL